MNASQQQTIARYQSFLDATALAACLECATGSGVFRALRSGPKDLPVLAELCGLDSVSLAELLRVLVAEGAIEQYGEDYALSQAISLIASPDADMGQQLWSQLPDFLTQGAHRESSSGAERIHAYRQRISSRQWSHTSAAMQAAEALNIGGAVQRLKVLELGSGAGVWSAAMAYRDTHLRVTAVDHPMMLAQCSETYESIDLLKHLTLIEDDYRTWSTPLGAFDLVILPEIVQLECDAAAVVLLGRAADALRVGGQVAVIETLREPDGPAQALATQGLELAVATGGRQRTTKQLQRLLTGAGFENAQWGWLNASPHGIGLIVATKAPEL